jgi:DNA mismatch repair protein MutS
MKCHLDVEKFVFFISFSKRDQLIFLYKFSKGRIDKSYGLQVAKMAGISEKVIVEAKKAAEKFEKNIDLVEYGTIERQKELFELINPNMTKLELIDLRNRIIKEYCHSWK